MNTEKRKSGDETSRVPEESSSNSISQENQQRNRISRESLSSSTPTSSTSSESISTSGSSDIIEPSITVLLGTTNSSNIQTGSHTEISGATNNSTRESCASAESDEMKRVAAKKLIERYFYQLLDGCGNPKCNNKYCASSGEVEKMTPNQAAARAIQLFSQDAKLCESQPMKVARTSMNDKNEGTGSSNSAQLSHSASNSTLNSKTQDPSTSGLTSINNDSPVRTNKKNRQLSACNHDDEALNISRHQKNLNQTSEPESGVSSEKDQLPDLIIDHLDEEILNEIIKQCETEKSNEKLTQVICKVFSSFDDLSESFIRRSSNTIDEMLEKAPKDLKSIKKEDLRALEGDLDKDEDSSAEKEETINAPVTVVDLPGLRRALQKLFEFDCIYLALDNSIQTLAVVLNVSPMSEGQEQFIEKSIHIFVIIFEVIAAAPSEFLEMLLPNICKAASRLPIWAQARLAKIWSEHCKPSMRSLLQTLQQLISLQVITGNYLLHANEIIINATKVLKILYYANILAGELEPVKFRESDNTETSETSDEDSCFNYWSSKQPKSPLLEDKLSTELGVSALDCRTPFIPFEEFYNEPLSDAIDMDHDYLFYKNITYQTPKSDQKFSFMFYSFILTPATKITGLYYDSRIRMYSERRTTLWAHSSGQSRNPYLKLKIRRDQIINDALVELEVIAMSNPKDLKKQLVVEFVGEQGIDEGGVSKEFFQLIVEEIFNPDYGMFIYQEDTKTVWFNSTSFENEAQFTLIGIVLGLAIYNNIILAVNFPMVVYRKLMGLKGSFKDLADWNPVIYRSLQSLLEYEENDMEEVFMQTFKISYKDVFGNTLEHELKPNGGDIFVNQENKHEFIELYSDFLLNTGIEKQFKAFINGFQMVTDESPLHLLFRPEEIELLVCGSKKFDFNELEKSTEYEGGYTKDSKIIIDFWDIVHALSLESKRKLLEFTTGSDRVPVGGLSRLKLVIARNGPDSDRLPTSHTCFNVLLLPEYESKEKLEDRLLKAINYSKGFGML